MMDCINTIYQFIKPFLKNKMSTFEEYGAFMGECLDDPHGTEDKFVT